MFTDNRFQCETERKASEFQRNYVMMQVKTERKLNINQNQSIHALAIGAVLSSFPRTVFNRSF